MSVGNDLMAKVLLLLTKERNEALKYIKSSKCSIIGKEKKIALKGYHFQG